LIIRIGSIFDFSQITFADE
jgi:hypothetical protein